LPNLGKEDFYTAGSIEQAEAIALRLVNER
jgi:hypothetical protein